MVPSSRRRFLAGLGVVGTAGLAGCLDAIPRFPKRVHDRDAVLTPRSDGWRSKHGGSARRGVTDGSLPSDATASPVLAVDDWWEVQPVFGPDEVVVPVQLPPESDAHEPSFEGLVALDSKSGDERWRFAYEKPFATPTVVGDTVFVQGKTTYALDRTDGTRYWEYRSGYGYAGTAPVFVDGVVAVIASRSRTVAGVDARTGEKLWSTPLVSEFPTGIASDGDSVYACTPGGGDDGPGELARLDASTGAFEWRTDLDARVSTPTVGTDRVYAWVGRRLAAFDGATGDELWSVRLRTSDHRYPPVVVDGGQCLTLEQKRGRNPNPTLVALDATSGEVQWRGPSAHELDTVQLAANETHVYVVLDSHDVAAVDRTDGTVTETWELPGHPTAGVAVDDGTAAVVTREEFEESVTLLN
ncbi:outer membrane protein assembly factor BamB family protein [Halogeometricum limi]|uniref:Outer membrane protein assembly factor BamB, contains PQQ-like beta-propeller repeat n=1 Tax=Halogeometricum limi TaxID=555875 RepID=A0A1I6IFZ2_9EURY|nr:PQQ-binding-like beta-propeller repeat protein [Halogeometricum limi]SFR65240.1 Outer membrane protein assembly factor BamB, contains PQQ-like beta-propeller repeat [Halogeometricum limi]